MPEMPATFRPSNMPPRGASDRAYEARRGSARDRGYTPQWDRASRAYLSANPLCLGCLAVGRTVPAVLTDHIIPHKGDLVAFWDQGNWQASCKPHHDKVKQKLEQLYHAGRLDAAALKLDSAAAVELTRDLLGDFGK